MASMIRHPFHMHPLQLMGVTDLTAAGCGACGLPFTSGSQLYGCRHCSVFLHRTCASLPEFVFLDPPLHQYSPSLRCSADDFNCNICGKVGGRGLNYGGLSNFVAHVLCPHLPRTARLQGRRYPLRLVFQPPATVRGRITCDGCHLPIRHCYYNCNYTNFDLHPWCLRRRPAGTSNLLAGTSNSLAGTSNSLAVTTISRATPSMGKMFWGITKVVARKCAMHLLFDPLGGFGELLDQLLFGGQDVADLHDYCSSMISGAAVPPTRRNDFSRLDIVTFENLPYSVGEHLQEEAISLLWAHMERMGAGETASSSRLF